MNPINDEVWLNGKDVVELDKRQKSFEEKYGNVRVAWSESSIYPFSDPRLGEISMYPFDRIEQFIEKLTTPCTSSKYLIATGIGSGVTRRYNEKLVEKGKWPITWCLKEEDFSNPKDDVVNIWFKVADVVTNCMATIPVNHTPNNPFIFSKEFKQAVSERGFKQMAEVQEQGGDPVNPKLLDKSITADEFVIYLYHRMEKMIDVGKDPLDQIKKT